MTKIPLNMLSEEHLRLLKKQLNAEIRASVIAKNVPKAQKLLKRMQVIDKRLEMIRLWQ